MAFRVPIVIVVKRTATKSSNCAVCDRMFANLEAATVAVFRIKSSLAIAQYSHDEAMVEKIAGEVAEAQRVRALIQTAIDAHRADGTCTALSEPVCRCAGA